MLYSWLKLKTNCRHCFIRVVRQTNNSNKRKTAYTNQQLNGIAADQNEREWTNNNTQKKKEEVRQKK